MNSHTSKAGEIISKKKHCHTLAPNNNKKKLHETTGDD